MTRQISVLAAPTSALPAFVGVVLRRFFILVLAPCLLAACGGGERVRGGSGTDAVAASGRAESSDARSTRRGGGYYKDDGPGDEIPDNLDDLPDAVPRQEPLHRFANRPYNVFGKYYTPASHVRPFRQRGVASWYGKKFHGQKTSTGERYDMFAMTAAHPTLPLPSYARITNPANGKSVVVRVNDRGPFHSNRIIDLSYAAAHRLGYIKTGSTLVEVEAIVPGKNEGMSRLNEARLGASSPGAVYAYNQPPSQSSISRLPSPVADERDDIARIMAEKDKARDAAAADDEAPIRAPTSGIYLQIGAFASGDNAESLRAHLARELDWLNGVIHVIPSGRLYRVQVGPYVQRSEAEQAAEKIHRTYGGQKPRLVTYNR